MNVFPSIASEPVNAPEKLIPHPAFSSQFPDIVSAVDTAPIQIHVFHENVPLVYIPPPKLPVK